MLGQSWECRRNRHRQRSQSVSRAPCGKPTGLSNIQGFPFRKRCDRGGKNFAAVRKSSHKCPTTSSGGSHPRPIASPRAGRTQGRQMTTREPCEQRGMERTRVAGIAAILDFGYLGLVYELVDFSLVGARIRGPRRPPETSFEILLHLSDRFIECRARPIWETQDFGGYAGIAFETQWEPASPPMPRGLLDHRLGIPLKPTSMLEAGKRKEGHLVSFSRTH